MKRKNTKIVNLITILIICIVPISCQSQPGAPRSDNLIDRLEHAETTKDIHLIDHLFIDDAWIIHPDGLPVVGKEAILSLYDYIWSRSEIKTIAYHVDSTASTSNLVIESGYSISIKEDGKENRTMYKATFLASGKEYKISKIEFGDKIISEYKLPELLEPSGKYHVGQSTHFYEKSSTDQNRVLAFQIWYPANTHGKEYLKVQNQDVVKASGQFLGWPLFFNSYFSIMESNSAEKIPIFPQETFPILLYNHGYSGFTSVYQTIFEDLASHGYIVVSIAHEDESALMITEDGIVIPNDPDNHFYRSRASELNRSEIKELKDFILTSDDIDESRKAYQELVAHSPLYNTSTRLWANDTQEVIKKLREINKSHPLLKNAFDFNSIGIFGHSLGGAVSGQLAMRDTLIQAGINLDGFQFGDLIGDQLKVPFMFVSSNPSGDSFLRASVFIEESQKDCYQVVIKGFSHGSFTDWEYFNPGGQEAIELQRDLIRTFFDKYLKKNDLNLTMLEDKYPLIRITKN